MAGDKDRRPSGTSLSGRGKRREAPADAKQRQLELDKQQRPPADKQIVGGWDKSIRVRATQ